MTQEDFDRFDALMQGVADCYGQTLTAQGIALRFKMLEQFEFSEVEKAALCIMATRKFTSMPTPADFLEYLGGGSLEDQAEVESGKVLSAIERVGGYNSVVFDDPVTQAVIVQAYGGWPKLCAVCGVEESEHWFRKNFAKTWAAYKRRGVAVFGKLEGRHEIANAAGGQRDFIQPPKLIGDPAAARAVLEAGQKQNLLEGQPVTRGNRTAPTSAAEILNIAGVAV